MPDKGLRKSRICMLDRYTRNNAPDHCTRRALPLGKVPLLLFERISDDELTVRR